MHFLKNEPQPGEMKIRSFHKILVANRGEIAVRIIKAIRETGKVAVVIHSDVDKNLPFVTMADEAYSLGNGTLSDTYLNTEKIIQIARESGAEAIHPGYGFLSENADFARACAANHIVFIGPDHDVIDLMGNKINAREKAVELGVPVLEGDIKPMDELVRQADTYTYPQLVKPAAGGGGKGMHIVRSSKELKEALHTSAREAAAYFGSDELFIERYIEAPRHIEVQVIADHQGNAVHLFERECSLQRRYQKIIEEAPSGFISAETRNKITSAALKLVMGIGYVNAGTVEFLVDADQNFYFLEMNTRIQVEHPVTEMITGIDLVREQISIAQGNALSFRQEDLHIRGHAIEARVYAEDPAKEFMPSTGRIDALSEPDYPWTRIDGGYRENNLIEPYYDPMIAKVITGGKNREEARAHLVRTLKDYHLTGITTNRDFLLELLQGEDFSANIMHTRYIDEHLQTINQKNTDRRKTIPQEFVVTAASLMALEHNYFSHINNGNTWYAIGHWRIQPELLLQCEHEELRIPYELIERKKAIRLFIKEEPYQVELEQKKGNHYWVRINEQLSHFWGYVDRSELTIDLDGHLFKARRLDVLDERFVSDGSNESISGGKNEITAPLNGKVVQINVRENEPVAKGDTLLVIESMKMENKIMVGHDARISKIHVNVGDQVQMKKLVITLA